MTERFFMSEKQVKKIPYGISDYEIIRTKNYFYVDKTRYLGEIENAGRYLFFLRPRRFGKSLFLSLMESYYDIAKNDNFDLFFKGTAVHKEPSPEKNTYLVLKFNFSAVDPAPDKVEDSFLNNVRIISRSFLNKYKEYFNSLRPNPPDIEKWYPEIDAQRSASDILLNILNLARDSESKLYILIDEYDNFANTILSTLGSGEYRKITRGSGFLRSFFNVLKDGTSGSGAPVHRLFVTGVSPITMDDVTSGFNIGKNITNDARFNRMLGFTPDELIEIITYYRSERLIRHDNHQLLEIMSRWYNHYCFSQKAQTSLFNTDMVLYFVDQYIVDRGFPGELVDENVRIDYDKLKHLIIIDQEDRKKTNGNFGQLKRIIEDGEISYKLIRSFSAEKIADPQNFVSLLFYFGLLTIVGEERGKIRFKIPNETVKHLYFEYIKEGYQDTQIFSLDFYRYSELMTGMAYDGQWQQLFHYLTGQMKESMSLRDFIQGEKSIQAFLAVYLGLGDLYLIHTEKELSKGYADITLEPFVIRYKDMKYSYILEIKYIKPKEFSERKMKAVKSGAEVQLKKYSSDKKFKKMIGSTTLIKLVLIFSGHHLKYIGTA